jgi:hypothetical protein
MRVALPQTVRHPAKLGPLHHYVKPDQLGRAPTMRKTMLHQSTLHQTTLHQVRPRRWPAVLQALELRPPGPADRARRPPMSVTLNLGRSFSPVATVGTGILPGLDAPDPPPRRPPAARVAGTSPAEPDLSGSWMVSRPSTPSALGCMAVARLLHGLLHGCCTAVARPVARLRLALPSRQSHSYSSATLTHPTSSLQPTRTGRKSGQSFPIASPRTVSRSSERQPPGPGPRTGLASSLVGNWSRRPPLCTLRR